MEGVVEDTVDKAVEEMMEELKAEAGERVVEDDGRDRRKTTTVGRAREEVRDAASMGEVVVVEITGRCGQIDADAEVGQGMGGGGRGRELQ